MFAIDLWSSTRWRLRNNKRRIEKKRVEEEIPGRVCVSDAGEMGRKKKGNRDGCKTTTKVCVWWYGYRWIIGAGSKKIERKTNKNTHEIKMLSTYKLKKKNERNGQIILAEVKYHKQKIRNLFECKFDFNPFPKSKSNRVTGLFFFKF